MPRAAVPPSFPIDRVADPRPARLGRLRRVVRWAGLGSVALAGIAVLLAMRGGDAADSRLLVLAALGTGLLVLVATALMALAVIARPAGPAGRSGEDRP